MCLMKNHIAAFGLSLLIAAPAFAFDVNGKGQDSLLGGDANVCHREPWRCTKTLSAPSVNTIGTAIIVKPIGGRAIGIAVTTAIGMIRLSPNRGSA